MGLSGAERGQSIQIGAVLLFGILIIFLATYQAFVVPSQNKEVEFKHSERVQSQLQDLRNAVVSSASRETSKSVAIDLGTTYPSRIIALNPPPTSGTLRTVGTSNGSVALAIDNATAVDAETEDFWNGTKRGYSTGLLTYDPDYNLLKQMPTTVYGNTVLYNAFGEKSLPITGQTMIDGNELSLFVLNGSLNTGGSGTRTVDVRPVSASEQSVLVEPEGSSNITISFPSKLSAKKWRDLLESEMSDSTTDDRYVTNVSGTSGTGAFNTITVTLEASATYRMRMVKVGVGTNVEAEGAAYLTAVDGAGASVESGGTTEVTLEVRDAFNNPVSSVLVNASASSGTFVDAQKASGVNGQVSFTYEAGGSTGDQKVNFSLHPIGDTFDSSTAENVSVDVTVTTTGASSNAFGVNWKDPSAQDGVTCPDGPNEPCEVDGSVAENVIITSLTSPRAENAEVRYAVNDTAEGKISPRSGTTDSLGEDTATLEVLSNGWVKAYVWGGGTGDIIEFHLTNVPPIDNVIVYASGGVLKTIENGTAPQSYSTSGVVAIGPYTVDIDNDGTDEIPFVNQAGNLWITDSSGKEKKLIDNGVRKKPSLLAVGTWQESQKSVFYVANNGKLSRVDANGDTVELGGTGGFKSTAVAGTGDIDGDSKKELVYGNSQTLKYVDDDGSSVSVGVTYGTNSNQQGIGAPGDFDGDGTDRMVIADGSQNIALVDSSGTKQVFDLGARSDAAKAKKSPVASLDVDEDGYLEIVYVGSANGNLQYIDDGKDYIGDSDGWTQKTIRDSNGQPVSADADTGAA